MQYDKDILNKTGIFVFDNAVSTQICNDIIADFYANPKKQFKGLTGSGYKPNLKNTTDYYLKGKYADILNNVLKISLDLVLDARPHLKDLSLYGNGFQFQKNKKGQGFFKWHSDFNFLNLDELRILAPIFYLNDVEEGGHTEFMHQKFSIKPKAGKLVIFPATWNYYHRGVTPKSNNKYIVTTFINLFKG